MHRPHPFGDAGLSRLPAGLRWRQFDASRIGGQPGV